MSTPMPPKNVRATDQADFSAEKRSDFHIRKHGLSSSQVQTMAFAALVITAGVTFLVYNNMLLGSIMCTLFGVVLFVFAKQLEGRKKELLSTEFLNALFASALASGHKFCMIVKQEDGLIVYLNNAFQQMFPDMVETPKRTLETLLSMYYVSDAERKNVVNAIRQNGASQVPLQIQGGSDRKTHSITLLVEPIARPSGFCLIRAK
jgi:hypothetical protein